MSQNPYVDCQKLLQEMVSRYEEMFAEFEAMRQVFREEMVKELPLMTRYEQALSGLRDLVHADFAPLRDEIQRLSEDSLASTLISKIPRVPSQR